MCLHPFCSLSLLHINFSIFSLGAGHDGSVPGCTGNTYIMSGSVFNPLGEKLTTFNKFSSCSVDQFINYINM